MTNAYFQPTVANDRNTSKRIAAAYAAAGIAAPTAFSAAVKAHVRTIPGADQEAASIAAEAFQLPADTDLADWWTGATDRMIRAQGSDALKHALTSSLEAQERGSASRQVTRALEDLEAYTARQMKALTAAAVKLPAGTSALDPEAVLAADAGAALVSARQALASLALVASVPDTAARHVGSLGYYAHVVSLVDPGKPVQEVATVFGKTMNAAKLDTTHALRKLAQDVKTNPDLALVDVARGAYPDVTLAPATDPATITDRATRARDAFTTRQPTPSEESLIHMR